MSESDLTGKVVLIIGASRGIGAATASAFARVGAKLVLASRDLPAMQALAQFDFPGNVRQLENFCHWLTVMAPGQTVGVADLPPEVRAAQLPVATLGMSVQAEAQHRTWQQLLATDATLRLSRSDPEVWLVLTQMFERTILQASLDVCRGRRVEAAARLGMGRNTITRKLRELGMDAGGADIAA